MPARSSETRRIHSLLGQRRASDVVMVIILSVALLAGLIGFAVHVLWIVAIVVLASGSATWWPTPPGSQRGHRSSPGGRGTGRVTRPVSSNAGPHAVTMGKWRVGRVPESVPLNVRKEARPNWRSGSGAPQGKQDRSLPA